VKLLGYNQYHFDTFIEPNSLVGLPIDLNAEQIRFSVGNDSVSGILTINYGFDPIRFEGENRFVFSAFRFEHGTLMKHIHMIGLSDSVLVNHQLLHDFLNCTLSDGFEIFLP